MATKRTAKEVLAAIDRIADDPLLPETPIELVDEELREAGLDPEAVGRRGKELAERLLAKKRAELRADVTATAAPLGAKVEEARARPKATREAMLARVRAAEADPRYAGQIAVAARGRLPDDPTDEELVALCAKLDALGILPPN